MPATAWIRSSRRGGRAAGRLVTRRRSLFRERTDGARCLYAQRIDRATGKPVGDPFVVQHFPGGRTTSSRGSTCCRRVRETRFPTIFFYDLDELSANIWIMSPATR